MDVIAVESKWDEIYQGKTVSTVADVLSENSFLLPEKGRALDLACGLGANALFLADKGLNVEAWDISSVALAELQEQARQNGLKVSTKQCFIDAHALPKNTFDVVVLSRFLDRNLCNAIMDCLKTDGLLFYQTYVKEKLDSYGPKNPDFLLDRNELLYCFQSLKLVFYRENSLVGCLQQGERNEALFIGQKN